MYTNYIPKIYLIKNEVKTMNEKQNKQTDENNVSAQYAPEKDYVIVPTKGFLQLKKSLVEVATQIRKAIMTGRPIILTHHNDTDGYCAGILLERAIVPLIFEQHNDVRYLSNYFVRYPSRTPYYDLIDATKDIGAFLQNMDRNKMQAPLIIVADNGSTPQDLPAIQKVKLFGADVVVVDHHDPGTLDENGKSQVCHEVLAHVNPHLIGLTKNFSASMLCFQLAYFINAHHHANTFMAALGGVADYCEGDSIAGLISKTEYDRAYFEAYWLYVEYELFLTKLNQPKGALYTLLEGTQEEREKLVALYKPLFEKAHVEVVAAIKQFTLNKTCGTTQAHFVNGEHTTLWSDYFTIGKIAGIAHKTYDGRGVTIVHSDQVVVLRAQENIGFDTNVLVKQLREKLPYGRVSGGGHNVAGSIKFVRGVKDEVLTLIETYIATL